MNVGYGATFHPDRPEEIFEVTKRCCHATDL